MKSDLHASLGIISKKDYTFFHRVYLGYIPCIFSMLYEMGILYG